MQDDLVPFMVRCRSTEMGEWKAVPGCVLVRGIDGVERGGRRRKRGDKQERSKLRFRRTETPPTTDHPLAVLEPCNPILTDASLVISCALYYFFQLCIFQTSP